MSENVSNTETRYSPLPGTIVKAADLAILDNLASVQAEIQAKREETRLECEALRKDAKEEGRREGLADAAIAGARIVAATTARMQATIDALSGSLADATMDAAEQIIGEPSDPDVAKKAITAALARAQRHMSLRLFVWPAAADRVRDAAERAVALRDDDVTLLSVDPDLRLEPGRIVLASERGYVELGVAEQLDVAKDIVRRSFDAQIADLEADPAEDEHATPDVEEERRAV